MFAFSAPFSLTFSFPFAGIFTWFDVKVEVTTLKGVELGRTGLDAEFLGDHPPALVLPGLVDLYDFIGRLSAELAELEYHEGSGRLSNGVKDDPDPGFGNTEIDAHRCTKAAKVGLCPNVEIAEEGIKPPHGDSRSGQ